MAKRANGIAEFSLVGTVMTWTYGGEIAATTLELTSNPEFAGMSPFSQSVYRNGIKQKVGDAGALPSGATVAEKATAQREMADQLTRLEYAGSGSSVTLEALARAYPTTTPAQIAAGWKSATKAERAAIERDPRIVEFTSAILIERAKKSGVDNEAMFEKLFSTTKTV